MISQTAIGINSVLHTRRALLKTAMMAGIVATHRWPIFAEEKTNSQSQVVQMMSKAQALEDFHCLRQALEEAHAGLYRYANKVQMDNRFDACQSKINRPMSHTAFWVIVSQMLTSIRCGHTGTNPPVDTSSAAAAARKFPFRVQIEHNDRLFVLLNDSSVDQATSPGMEVLEINGHAVKDILARMFGVISGDGDILTAKQAHMDNFALYYWLLFEQDEQFRIGLRSSTGGAFKIVLDGVLDSDREKNKNPLNDAVREGLAVVNWSHNDFALRFMPDTKIAEMSIRHFAGNQYPTWLEDSFKTLREQKVESLILDLRGNGGGVDMYGASLISHLVSHEFRYFDHIRMRSINPSFSAQSDWNQKTAQMLATGTVKDHRGGYLAAPGLQPGLLPQQPAQLPFLGRLIVLTNGRTFSTAADVAAVLKNLKRGTFIGQETGGGFQGNNSGIKATVILPNSNLHVGIPMWAYWNSVDDKTNQRRGTIPDQAVSNTVASLMQGVDIVRGAALTRLETTV